MLPSTGYFNGINCPFYNTGLCDRPYCHFRHVRKEAQNINGDGVVHGEKLQKLVSAAVQKVLKQTECKATSSSKDNPNTNQLTHSKATYNPTPISELNKNNSESETQENSDQRRRHIPVPYTPRKPSSLQIKRPVDTLGSKLYVAPVQYTPGAESAQLDTYSPIGSVKESNEKYKPGTETKIQEYTISGSQSSSMNYVPSDKYTSKKRIIEYKPAVVSKKVDFPSVKYQPTPKNLVPCFSSDEDEPPTKKQKTSNDLNGFDDLGPEFDILDQILDDEEIENEEMRADQLLTKKEEVVKLEQLEKKCDKVQPKSDKEYSESEADRKKESVKKQLHEKDSKDSIAENCKKHKDHEKTRSQSSSKSSHREQNKHSKDPDRKSNHKSSKTDKTKESSNKYDKKSHSSSKVTDHHSKSSDSKKNTSSHTTRDSKSSKTRKEDKKKKHDTHSKSHKKTKHEKKKKEDNKSETISDCDQNMSDNMELQDEELLSELDDEDIAEECKRIFEEYVPEPKAKIPEENTNTQEIASDEEYIPTKKRISRAIDKDIKVIPKPTVKPNFKVSAAQAMAERLVKIKQFHANKNIAEQTPTISNTVKTESSKLLSGPGNTKIRIAHVPYASTMLTAKRSISTVNTIRNEPSTSIPSTSMPSTTIQTVKKGSQRVAHVPNDKFIDRPGVLEPLGSKIPANIRSTYLNLMIDQCLKIYSSPTDAYARAQHEELTTSKKCNTVPIYKNSSVLAISRLKKELQECNGVKKSGPDCSAALKTPNSNTGAVSGSWSIENRGKKNYDDCKQYSGAKFYNNIKKWILNEDDLQNNGFPRVHSSGEKGRAIIYGQNKQTPPKGFIRTCCRCKKEYTIDKKGFPSIKEDCIYHPNKKYRYRGEVKYQCCSQDGTSDGCCIASTHVYEYTDFDNLKGYIKTMPPEREMEDYGVYALDCEMCYTTHGLDLTRVTVINSECKVIYETLIKPLHPIVDYNTRYSGITEEQMMNVRTTLLEVQATLLAMFNSRTILIGHSLESDFKALKLIHDTVIDTSVLFPHKMGPPYKRALRNLSSEYLKKIIQNSVDGHDSAEDATVCMQLIHYKLREDLKTR
ncbi:RNA exonuclease 1 homolog [Leptidea sinapis]|uniref:RNA exonuclease 1 homolog n=1 Tax=Leptidea sinapis TaxID=189913 RepID=UPI0021C336F9|nr:RNA exonuclease 1 homolog [Leptidea sinapis]